MQNIRIALFLCSAKHVVCVMEETPHHPVMQELISPADK
jgi:hypothetical protein